MFGGPFGFPLDPSLPFGLRGTSTLETRCRFPSWRSRLLFHSSLPVGTFESLQIDAAEWTRPREAHPCLTPDFLLLPASGYFLSAGCGSTLKVRYALLGSLFLVPLGTNLSMRLRSHGVKGIR